MWGPIISEQNFPLAKFILHETDQLKEDSANAPALTRAIQGETETVQPEEVILLSYGRILKGQNTFLQKKDQNIFQIFFPETFPFLATIYFSKLFAGN